VERKSVLHLFTGDTFYSSRDAALREAVLNAIDAVERLGLIGAAEPPSIALEFLSNPLRLVISDNGTGMTRAELSNLFAKVGASASRVLAPGPTSKIHMIGEFGIGVMSYFLVGDAFEVDTKSGTESAVALRFHRSMIDEDTPAEVVASQRTERGTTLTLFFNDQSALDQLVAKFPFWIRNVAGLVAKSTSGEQLIQGGLSRAVLATDVQPPEWIFSCTLGPPVEAKAWQVFDGKAHVDVLYSGVFVESIDVQQLWGVEGSIYVDPKKFRPKLNREGFVGNGLRAELDPFLRSVHPRALERAAELLPGILADASVWSTPRAATIWLAIPRGGEYSAAAAKWDRVFRSQRLIRQLRANNAELLVSVDELIDAKAARIYLAPLNWGGATPSLRAAIRLLRDQGELVIVGVERDGGYLQSATFAYASTETVLVSQFVAELPQLIPIQNEADAILRREALVDVAFAPVRVRIVAVGPEASAMLIAGPEVWINAGVDGGKAIARHLCEHPYGLSSLLAACLAHAPDQIQNIANLFRGQPDSCFSIGAVRRQLIQSRVL